MKTYLFALAVVVTLPSIWLLRSAPASRPILPVDDPIPLNEPNDAGAVCKSVKLINTNGQPQNPAAWTKVTHSNFVPANVRDLLIESGNIRVTYEFLNEDQEGSHSLYLWTSGGVWERATSSYYGDYSYWVSSLAEPATSVEITRLTRDWVELSYHFDIYPTWGPSPHIQLTKRVGVKRCQPGMFVKFEGTPTNAHGEREFGIGEGLPLSFSEQAVALHPIEGFHHNMGMAVEPEGPRWAAAAGPDSLLRVLTLARPMVTYSYQFHPVHLGRIVVNAFKEGVVGDSGYDAFLGVAPYDSDAAVLEMEDLSGTVVADVASNGGAYSRIHRGNAASFDIVVPEDGDYALWVRSKAEIAPELLVSVAGQEMMVMNRVSETFTSAKLVDVTLMAGSHPVMIEALGAAVDIDSIMVLPNGLARNMASSTRSHLGD